ncbi:hypothetical protein ACFWII_07510 [Streptomyces sp. NPDC127063]|uniref:hypothetical protein n=1 Tax=Streptomyces sp. NPDC127063 TaxID=3347123 RepID=UPI0036548050
MVPRAPSARLGHGRQDWPDGRVSYQVHVDLYGDTRVSVRMYQWPQPGLRAARRRGRLDE